MKVLITAGGTAEKIDDVRAITNHSTGRLGSAIAAEFLAQGHEVIYVCTPTAVAPAPQTALTCLTITTTADLVACLQELFQKQTFDAIIHSMAVSDFTTESSCTQDALVEQLAEQLLQQPRATDAQQLATQLTASLATIAAKPIAAKKISSKTERLVLFLKKNPKIIASLRAQQPQAIIVGFKLLVDVPIVELLSVAKTSLMQNDCDFILANDLTTITADQHIGYLLHRQGEQTQATTKADIARLIVTQVTKKWEAQTK